MAAIALKAIAAPIARPAITAAPRRSLRRNLAHCWDLFAVLALFGSSAAYAVHTLLHLA